MPTRPWASRISVAGLAGRPRRTPATAKWTLPVLMAALLAAPGCRSDQGATRLPALNPTRWFEREAAAESADGVDLQPVPGPGALDTPPLPPAAPSPHTLAPSPAPAPEPVEFDEQDGKSFYSVRPTAAELAGPAEPSWTGRFRSLFRRETSSRGTTAGTTTARPAAAAKTEPSERPPIPPGPAPRRRNAVTLGRPIFDVIEPEPATAEPPRIAPAFVAPTQERTVEPASRTVPARTAFVDRGPLPVIRPGRASVRNSDGSAPEPAEWPHAASDAQLPPAPVQVPTEATQPEPFEPTSAPPLLLIAP